MLPFGEDKFGRLVRVSDVERGAACNCTCPNCGANLIARKGEELQHHFAHAGDGCGSGALETSLHKMAKQIIADVGKIWLPPLVVYFPAHPEDARSAIGPSGFRTKDGWLEVQFEVERRLDGGLRPDLIADLDDGTSLAVEVFVTHAVPKEKRERLQCLNLTTLEIDLSRYPRDFDVEKLINFVTREAPRSWLHHRHAAGLERKAREDYHRRWDLYEAERKEAQEAAHRAAAEQARLAALSRFPAYGGPPLDLPDMVAGLLHVSHIRPSFWRGPEAYPSPGSFCVECASRQWARFEDGWACVQCVPPDIQARISAT